MKRNAPLTSVPFRKGASPNFNIIFLLVMIFILNTSCKHTSNNNKQDFVTYTNDYGLSFDLPDFCEILSGEDLERIRRIDPTITFMALTGLPFVCSTISILVYDLHKETLLDSAFVNTVEHFPTPPDEDPAWNYRLIDYGTQMVDSITLRYKISCVDSTDYHIMYYFMKNNRSNILFEMKATCYSPFEINSAKDFIEGIALTFKFLDK